MTREEVVWAYEMLLGRAPESESVVEFHRQAASIQELRRNVASSDEALDELLRLRRTDPQEGGAPVDRRERVLRHIDTTQLGIEIGAWFNPLVPRRLGYRALTLDVFDQDTLRRIAAQDPAIDPASVDLIEPVDLLGSVTDLKALVRDKGLLGQVDYIVSSHNFEHVPDPVTFLKDCQSVLRPGGLLSMAIPDKRTCFDFFRPHSVTADFLDAHWSRRTKPAPFQHFTHISLKSFNPVGGGRRSGWHLHDDASAIQLEHDLDTAYAAAMSQLAADAPYRDAHCWALTPAAFSAILLDLQALGLVGMSAKSVEGPNGHEFYVHLVNQPPHLPDAKSEAFQTVRTELMHRVNDEILSYGRSVIR